MGVARRRAYIKQQAALKKQVEGQTSKGTGLSKLFTKRKQQEKSNCLPKKPKTIPKSVIGLEAEAKKTVITLGYRRGKVILRGKVIAKKPPVLLREDSKYALEKLSSIITFDDFEDLSKHAIEAMGETRLFCIAQVTCPSFSLFLSFNLPCSNSILLSVNVNDEGADKPLLEPWDGSGPYQGKGKLNGGRAKWVEGLEDSPREKDCFIGGSKGWAGEVDRATKASLGR